MKGRTTRTFTYRSALWPLVDSWAAENGFVLEQQGPASRVFRKGHWLLMAPVWLEIRQEGTSVTLEAWVKADFFLILTLLTGQKAESRIESGGLAAAVPRKRARDAVNKLLVNLGQPPIA